MSDSDNTKQTIYMVGDSIIANESYVDHGHDTVSVLMKELDREGFDDVEVQKWAVDGYTTLDVINQIDKYRKASLYGFDIHDTSKKPNTTAVLSAGGNDALQSRFVLDQYVSSVLGAFNLINHALSLFKRHYKLLLEKMVSGEFERLIVFTVYNKIPEIISEAEITALALFNDVITEEVAKHKMAGANIDLIDLRVICDEPEDYSERSPIEPSHRGSQKIVRHLLEKL